MEGGNDAHCDTNKEGPVGMGSRFSTRRLCRSKFLFVATAGAWLVSADNFSAFCLLRRASTFAVSFCVWGVDSHFFLQGIAVIQQLFGEESVNYFVHLDILDHARNLVLVFWEHFSEDDFDHVVDGFIDVVCGNWCDCMSADRSG